MANLPYVVPQIPYQIEMRTIAALIHLGDPNHMRVQNAMLQLHSDCFVGNDHRVLFKLIEKLFTTGNEFDLVRLMTLVPNDQYDLLSEAVKEEYISTSHLESDIEKLLSYRLWSRQLKTLVNAVNRSIEKILPEEGLDVISQEIQALSAVCSSNKSIVRSYETIADEFLCDTEVDNSEFTVDIPYLPPVPNRALITIAGRSGHGKTFFALYLMDKIIDAQPGKQTLYFNLEMHESVMMERHANLLGIQGDSRREVIKNGIGLLLDKNVSLVSVPMITIDQIEIESRLAAIREPIAVIVVDYLGLVGSKAKYDRKDLQQSDIAKRLAALSIELDCVVICLIQVNREFKNRQVGDRCPIPSESSESMGSVYSASWWLGIDQPQLDDDSGEYENLFMVDCRKNRGAHGLFHLRLNFSNGMFSKYLKPFSARKPASPVF